MTRVYACACDTHEGARTCSFRSLPSADSNYSKGEEPRRDSSRKELSGLALLTPFLKPVSRVNDNTRRMRTRYLRKTVTRIYYNIVYPPPTRLCSPPAPLLFYLLSKIRIDKDYIIGLGSLRFPKFPCSSSNVETDKKKYME